MRPSSDILSGVAAKKHNTIDDYIRSFPDDAQQVLQSLRQTVRKAAPERATEAIRYNLAAIQLDGYDLLYFAGWKKHVSLYPITDAMKRSMKKEIAAYKTSGVTIQFPLDKPLPAALIRKIVKQRLKEVKDVQAC